MVHKVKPATEICLVISKSENLNLIVYQGQVAGGALKKADAVESYWILFARAADGSKQEPLNMIERNTAYGHTCKTDGSGNHSMVIAALKTKPIRVELQGEEVVCLTSINGVEDCKLKFVYVQMKEKAWVPGVQHLDLYGCTPDGADTFERLA